MLIIKFLGMGQQVDEIKRRLAEVQRNAPYPVKLEVVSEPDHILEHDIRGIPSIMVGDEVIADGRMPSTLELRHTINKFYLPMELLTNQKKDLIQRILVPMDASETALGALDYAKNIAKSIGAVVDILHVGSYHIDPNQAAMPMTIDLLRESRVTSLKNRIKPLYAEGETLPSVLYEVGFPVDVIASASKDYDLVIMGSTGEHGYLDRILGSISSGVAQKSHCPVVLIPKGMDHIDASKILCAFQSDNMYEDLVDKLVGMSITPKYKEIHFVEIIKPNNEKGGKLDKSIVQEVLKTNYKNIHFFVDQLVSMSIVDSLNDYAKAYDIGIIVMATRHRGPIESLFHKSQTKRMVLDIQRPLLILHTDD